VIHRDFKPHNVLRSKRGDKIVVTDFGLARDSGSVADAPRTTPMPVELTVPGSFLGTPAYMAPEQWTGGESTQATDQFAFCIALWEGFTGKRPFHGTTTEELRASVLRGVDHEALAQLPRRVRAAIARGLAVDPAQRWPSMVTLLARLEPRRRRIVAVAGGMLALAIAVALVARGGEAAATCEPAVIAPASVWGLAQQLQIRMGSADAARTLGTAFEHWRAARASVCADTGATRAAKLDCLDRVLLRIDAIRRGRLHDLGAGQWGVIAQLYDPEVCALADPPRMPNQYTEAAILGLAQRAGVTLDAATVEGARRDLEHDACARAYFAFMDPGPNSAELAKSSAQLCGDDQAYAAAMLNEISRTHRSQSREQAAHLREAERAVKHAAQPFLIRQYELFRAHLALDRGELDDAIAFVERAAGGDPMEFELQRRLLRAGMLLRRARGDDLENARREAQALKQLAPPSVPVPVFDAIDATARWLRGDVAAADALLVPQLRAAIAGAPFFSDRPALHGIVVDERGRGVPHVTVTAGQGLYGDSVTAAAALYLLGIWPTWSQTVETDAQGRFAIARNGPGALVVAQQGDRRSRVARFTDAVRLVLAPTTTIRGRVRGSPDRGMRYVSMPELDDYDLVAPIRGDGTFELAGVPVGPIELHAIQLEGAHAASGTHLEVDTARVQDVELEAPSARTLDVIVRSVTTTPDEAAQVTILAGTHVATTAGALLSLRSRFQSTTELARALVDEPPPALAKLVAPGDVIVHARGVPLGTITVCAQASNLEAAPAQPIHCEIVDATASHVLVRVPPMNRVD
ncbi:MAG: protein kinase, partial [Kofleriaceae bacterium]